MLDHASEGRSRAADYVEFAVAGAPAVGAFHCSQCGYGVTVQAVLPRCPMCSGTTWELLDWKPLAQQSNLQ